MEIFIAVLLLAVGIALIVKGGDFFVDAASWFAEVSGIQLCHYPSRAAGIRLRRRGGPRYG